MRDRTKALNVGLSAAAVTGGLIVAVGMFAPAATADTADTAQVDSVVTGCTINMTLNGPVIADDAEHACNGAVGAKVLDTGGLQVIGLRDTPVVSASCTTNDDLSMRGYACSLSGVAGSETIVRFRSSIDNTPVHAGSHRVSGENAAIALTFVHAS